MLVGESSSYPWENWQVETLITAKREMKSWEGQGLSDSESQGRGGGVALTELLTTNIKNNIQLPTLIDL